MELRHLMAFCEVAKERSFTQAATNLHCAQSTVTGYIKHLEGSLRTELIRRRGRKPIELTEAGVLLLARAQQVLGLMETAGTEIRGLAARTSAAPPAPPPSRPPVIAFFDVDETLITGKSMQLFLTYCQDAGLPLSVSRTDEFLRMFRQESVSRVALNRAYYRIYQGCTPTELERAGRAWFETELVRGDLFHQPVLQALRRHQDDGHLVVLVSGSFDACLAPIAAAVGADDVLCTRQETLDGILTGEITAPAIGGGKAERARDLMLRHGARPVDCYAYGDHSSDLPLLQSVGHPVLVGDDPELDAWACRRGWLRLPAVEGSCP